MDLLIAPLEMWHLEEWPMNISTGTAILNKLLSIENACNLLLTMLLNDPGPFYSCCCCHLHVMAKHYTSEELLGRSCGRWSRTLHVTM